MEKKKSPVGQKGYTGNPNGRPKKGETLTDALKEYAEMKDVGDGSMTRKQYLANRLWGMALKGDISAIKYIYDRVDGVAVQTIKQHITEENPVHEMIRQLVYGPESKTNTISDGE